ncbi:hypothetical protein B0A55_11712 [Friedmanniomyces simplex]|uniref:Uncharacterized protein n=1 Tax=Friedmanniomyces simplex TaxID=329884 RepID=A0A4U0WAE3_9PEZI|nr:hypothetical protein B0A55_11712 [Friedmanniomyces simplex]
MPTPYTGSRRIASDSAYYAQIASDSAYYAQIASGNPYDGAFSAFAKKCTRNRNKVFGNKVTLRRLAAFAAPAASVNYNDLEL